MRGKLSIMACLLALAMLLGACGGREPAKPTDSKPTASASEAPNGAEIRVAMAAGLVADRKNAHHTAEKIPRQNEQLDPPPARKRVPTPPPDRPPPAPAPSVSPPVAAAPAQAAEKATVEEAGLPKAAGPQPPAQVRTPSPAKPPPTPAPRPATRVAAAAPPPDPSEKLAGEPRYRVQLGAFRSRGKALRAMRTLTDALKGVVDERLFAINDSGNDGFVRVVLSAPFATRRAAAAACVVVKERGRDCYVARIR